MECIILIILIALILAFIFTVKDCKELGDYDLPYEWYDEDGEDKNGEQ